MTDEPEHQLLLHEIYDLLEAARTMRARHPDVVPGTSHEQKVFDDMLAEATTLRDALLRVDMRVDAARDLTRDCYLLLYKADDELRPLHQMLVTHLLNHFGVSAARDADDVERLRRLSRHDRYVAAMSAVDVVEAVADLIERAQPLFDQAMAAVVSACEVERPEDDEDAETLEAFADAIRDALADARGAVQDAVDEADTSMLGASARLAVSHAADKFEDEREQMVRWGLDPGEVAMMPFDDRHELSTMLRKHRLADYTRLIGRFRSFAGAQRAKRVEGRETPVGLELSGDPLRAVTSELAAYQHPMLRLDFLRRLTEEQLLSVRSEGTDRAGRGPVVACVDSSGSMSTEHAGITREAWAKALALALLHESASMRRDWYGYNFSVDMIELAAPRGRVRSLDLMRWASTFFMGGTDFDQPLSAAVAHIERSERDGHAKADLVFLTDGYGHLTQPVIDRVNAARERSGLRVWGVFIGEQFTPQLEAVCDDLRSVDDLHDLESVGDIFRGLAPHV